MYEDGRRFRLFAHGLVIFVSMGITIANEILTRVGFSGSSFYVYSLALLLVALMLKRRVLAQGAILGAVILLSAPEATLVYYNLNRDYLLSAICAGILVPTLYSLIDNSEAS
jgi:hypothetical protein